MSCHLPAHISRSEMLTFLPNFPSVLLGQAPCLFVTPNEHHFTFDGYWIDHCCHGLWWPFVFSVLLPNRRWGVFESAHTLFEVRFIGWGDKERRCSKASEQGRCSEVWGFVWSCFSPYFLMGCSHIVPPEASVPSALPAGRITLLWRVSSSARVRSSWSVVVSQPWHLAPLQG